MRRFHTRLTCCLPWKTRQFQLLAGAAKQSLKAVTEQKYFTQNFRYIAPAAILSLFLLFVRTQHPVVALLGSIGFTIAALYFGSGGVAWPDHPVRDASVAGIRLVILMFSFVFFAVLQSGSFAYLLSMIATVSINLYLAPQLRGRTPLGRELISKIEGYREFLKEVELDRMQRLKTPEWAPTPSTEYLAYAIALDMGDAWDNYRENSGYWVANMEKSRPLDPKLMVRVRAPSLTFDAWIGFGIAMVFIVGLSRLTMHVTVTSDSTASAFSGGALAAWLAIVFLVLFVIMAFRSR